MKRKREHPNIRAGRQCVNTQLRDGLQLLIDQGVRFPRRVTKHYNSIGDLLSARRK